ncbi:MAG: O-antigen ligase family protein [Flavobacteriales bacterium]|jgi:hypothetical protein|nr:O-antigen ligase family protein [Flavobacteriales bacterium]
MIAATSDLLRGRGAFRATHVGALALCVVMLPWSKAFVSIAQLMLVVNWLAEGVVHKDLKARFQRAFCQVPSVLFIGFFLLHVLGLAWTTDLDWGVDLVRILLPVLAFGAVLAASPRLHPNEFRAVLLLGAWSAVVSTIASLVAQDGHTTDYRALSVFISHIRLTLLLCMAVVVFVLDRGGPSWLRIAGHVAGLWALFFIDRLGSIQGYVILLVVAVVFVRRWATARGGPLAKVLQVLLVAVPVLLTLLVWNEVCTRFHTPDPAIIGKFEHTAGGEQYLHDVQATQMENGHHVWMYVAPGELERGWARRGTRAYQADDDKGHPIWSTLVRYMASKGLRKDSVGLASLNDADIQAIERGITNADPGRWGGLHARFDEVVLELQQYRTKGVADGHSVAMRIEYLKVGWRIARSNVLIGVGTGDTERAFKEEYERSASMLSTEWRHRAHNEYLTLWISFGVLGLCFALYTWWYPAWRLGACKRPLFLAWAIIFGISCLTDDTIETQVGATFFALYYTLLVFAAPTVKEGGSLAAGPARALV